MGGVPRCPTRRRGREGRKQILTMLLGKVIHVGGPGFHYGPNSGDKP
jgi:hypothetical protein